MPQPFDFDPFGLRLSKPPAFPLTLRERLIMQALQQARRRRQGGAPLPGPSLIEPLLPRGMFGETGQLEPKTGFEPFHVPPSFPKPTLRDLLTGLLQGGQFGI